MIAATECSKNFIENAFLKFYATAEVGDETCIYARSIIDKVRSSGAGLLIL